MNLVVIIPAFNEEATIADVVRRVPRSVEHTDRTQVIVVDDGSSDGTVRAARDAGARVVSHRTNRGVGAAFVTGVEAALSAGADVIVSMDGDGQFDPADIPRLLEPILEGDAEFVTCTRFSDPTRVPQMPWIKKWGNRVMTRLINRLVRGAHFTDVSCGFRAYLREPLERLVLMSDFTYTHETLLNFASQRVRMAEVHLPVRGTREYGTSRVAGSLPRYVAGALPAVIRTVRDLRPLEFFGGIALVLFGVGMVLGGFSLGHLALTGQTSPYQSVTLASAVALILGFLLLVLALLADMLRRHRRVQEETLYRVRKLEAARDNVPRRTEAPAVMRRVAPGGIRTIPVRQP